MEVPDRDQLEAELTAAVLALWSAFDTAWVAGSLTFAVFLDYFNQLVAPILSRIYGTARVSLAGRYGMNYRSRPGDGGTTVFQIPNLMSRLMAYAQAIWDSFTNRKAAAQQAAQQTQSRPPIQTQHATGATGSRTSSGGIRTAAQQQSAQQEATAIEEPVEVPEYTESDANRYAVTQVTDAHSRGELDAAADVEANVGTRLVAIWRTEPGACEKICAPLEGQTIRQWGHRFPDGPAAHPHCVLGETVVRSASFVRGFVGLYSGPIVRIKFSGSVWLRVTPNHMVLTDQGFVFAKSLMKGDNVIRAANVEDSAFFSRQCPNRDHGPATISEVFGSWKMSGGMRTRRVPVSPVDLHGDAAGMNGYVDVVSPIGELADNGDSSLLQPSTKLIFEDGSAADFGLNSLGSLRDALFALRDATDGGMGLFRELQSLFRSHLRHPNKHRSTASADFDSTIYEAFVDRASRDSERLGKLLDAFPSEITRCEVVDVQLDTVHEAVPVYDIETEESLYLIGDGIVTSNCRCHLEWRQLVG